MQNDLADQLIAANEEQERLEREAEKQAEEPQIDELGIPLPQVKTMQAQYNYLTARALYLNPHLYTRRNRGQLWNGHTFVLPNATHISRLARWAEPLTKQGAAYIYDKIKELIPYLDESVIAITPHLAWDIENQKIIKSKEEFNVISDW